MARDLASRALGHRLGCPSGQVGEAGLPQVPLVGCVPRALCIHFGMLVRYLTPSTPLRAGVHRSVTEHPRASSLSATSMIALAKA